jgi:hypothetical protein
MSAQRAASPPRSFTKDRKKAAASHAQQREDRFAFHGSAYMFFTVEDHTRGPLTNSDAVLSLLRQTPSWHRPEMLKFLLFLCGYFFSKFFQNTVHDSIGEFVRNGTEQ